MFESLIRAGTGTCANCGGPIVRFLGDLGSDEWTHERDDHRYSRECPGTRYAEPVEGQPTKGEPA